MRGEGIRLGVAGIAVSSTVSVELVPAGLDSPNPVSKTSLSVERGDLLSDAVQQLVRALI